MKITLDIPNNAMAAAVSLLCNEPVFFSLKAYTLSPEEMRDGATITLPMSEAKDPPNRDLPQGCWRITNVEDVRKVDQVVPCKDCQFWQRHTQVNRDYGKCGRFGTVTTRCNDFCSLGAKKSEE